MTDPVIKFRNPERLAYLAALVAIEAPARESSYANDARIPWSLINGIREVLTQEGFNWKLAATERKRLEDGRRRARRAQLDAQRAGLQP